MEANRPGPDEMYCFSCGSVIKRLAEICVHCGVRINSPPTSVTTLEFSSRSRIAAGILGLLLGGIGIHRFYLGNIGIGIVQIIVTIITFGLAACGGSLKAL